MHIGILKDFFTPGNVIYLGYWRSYDKVISFNNAGGTCWSVTVQECDEKGVPSGQLRTHRTTPDPIRDRVVSRRMVAA